MPVVIAASIDEALVRSSAGRHEAAWMAGVGAGWRAGVAAVMVEADVTSRGEANGLIAIHTVRGRASILAEAHLGPPGDRFRFVVGAGPAVTLAATQIGDLEVLTSLQGGRATVGLDGVLRGWDSPVETWTVGLRLGAFGHREGVDAELGLRTAWAF
ncbi:MAG: hypothetical protein EXR69_02405 [Myxococcales bacterium]|nr:hypothetical protein [Myxococcales bacterium]